MQYPDFFDNIETIKLNDPLADFLGTFNNGIIEFSYIDIVKSSGHSCPTVAGAYLVCLEGLKELYPETLPVRGEIKVEFKNDITEGVTGVISNVISQITGASASHGFKGINGRFARNALLDFNANINLDIRFIRTDTDKTIQIAYDPSCIAPDPRQKELMGKILQNKAAKEEKKLFKSLWQERVEKIFNNIDKVITVNHD